MQKRNDSDPSALFPFLIGKVLTIRKPMQNVDINGVSIPYR